MKKIFIYGAGYYGEQVFNRIRKKYKIIGFIDKDKKKIGKKIMNHRIYSHEIIKSKKFDQIFISSMWSEEIYQFLLKKYKINKRKILIYPISEIHKKSRKIFGWYKKFKLLINLFKDNNIKFYLDHSALLGFIRRNDVYGFNDIDLAVDYKDLKKIKQILKFCKFFKKIECCKIDVDQSYIGKNFNYQITIDDFIDLQIKFKKGNFYYWIIGSNILKAKTSLFKNIKKNKFRDIEIPIPGDPKKYLSILYGKTWKKPQKNWTYDDYNNIYKKIKFSNFKINIL